jgi:hypothetical protein
MLANLASTCLANVVPIFVILAKLDLNESLFLSHSLNLTHASHNFNPTFAVWQMRVVAFAKFAR